VPREINAKERAKAPAVPQLTVNADEAAAIDGKHGFRSPADL
jgi:hypothetical protein